MKLVVALNTAPEEAKRKWPPPITLVTEAGEVVEGIDITDLRIHAKGCSVTIRIQCADVLVKDVLELGYGN